MFEKWTISANVFVMENCQVRIRNDFFVRILFKIAFTCKFRPTESHSRRKKQVTLPAINGEKVVCITVAVGDDISESKNWKGGFYDATLKPKNIVIWNRRQLDGLVCVYEDVKNYHETISKFWL